MAQKQKGVAGAVIKAKKFVRKNPRFLDTKQHLENLKRKSVLPSHRK
jgi:hypothetical protein